jgi:tRNA A37 methylthiotransferase MiaB
VSQNRIIQRSRKLRAVSEAKLHAFYALQKGKEKEVIIEKVIDNKDGTFSYSGLSENYIPVSYRSDAVYSKGDLITLI